MLTTEIMSTLPPRVPILSLLIISTETLHMQSVITILSLSVFVLFAFPAAMDEKLSAAHTVFSLNLLKQLSTSSEPLVCSPASASLGLATIFSGARGETREQLRRILGEDFSEEQFQGFIDSLKEKEENVLFANKIYVHKGVRMKTKFKKNCRVDLEQVDFGDHEKAASKINDWEMRSTGTVPQFFDSLPRDEKTKILLLGGACFKGSWSERFGTTSAMFHESPSKSREVTMISDTLKCVYYNEDKTLKVLRIPFRTHDFSMIFFLPAQFEDVFMFLSKTDASIIVRTLKNARIETVTVEIPQFSISSKLSLKDPLEKMGVNCFSKHKADLSGISSTKGCRVTDVMQRAAIRINENGVGIPPLSTMRMVPISLAPTSKEFFADRPFFYFVVEERTGAVVLAGTYL
uniref:SERPIN domain-containing protein n=1 Tax=Steinernema glaseri TaxID=37863 RepID=A0A1I8AAM0_9BILA